MKSITRLEFLIGSAAATAGCKMFNFSSEGDSYSAAVLGDTHYDADPISVYHSHYDNSNPWAKIQNAEFVRNANMWKDRCPKLLNASASLAHREKTDFILQLGDIIQGDCDHVPTHKKMLDDCIKYLRGPYPEALPFLTVVGNHDFRGKGAWDAYFDFAEPFMTKEVAKLTGKSDSKLLKYPAFSFRKGPDLWVFCHFEMEDLNPISDLIDADIQARYVFLVTHGPFTTCSRSGAYRWRLGGNKKSDASRVRLYETLSRRKAIVLSGHTHMTNYYRHENKFGSFCEFTANSVWAKQERATLVSVDDDPSDYKALKGRFTDEQFKDFEEEVAFFKRGLVEYFSNYGAGHYRLDVSDAGVRMKFYPGDQLDSPRVFLLA